MTKIKLRWPKGRWNELHDLQRLLQLCQSFESANNFLAHAREAIRLAERLNNRSNDRKRPSFWHFLEELAAIEQEAS